MKVGDKLTIRKRKDGRWEGRATIGVDSNGKQKQKSVYGSSRKEVEEKLKKLKNSIFSGTFIENDSIRLGEWVKEWIEIYKKNSIKESTYECVMIYAIKHIYTHDISCLKLTQLKPFHFQAYYNEKLKVLAPASIRKLHNIFSASLNQAIQNELLNKNPAKFSEPPKIVKTEIEILSMEEQIQFIKALEGEQYKELFILALQTGMRIGELLALRWEDIDLKNMTLTIKHTARRIIKNFDKNFEGVRSVISINTPKTKTSMRVVPLMPKALIMLRRLKYRKQNECISRGQKWSNDKIVFDTQNGTLNEAKNINKYLCRICKNNGLKRITFHSLRHTFVSRMLEAGEDIKTISDIIGHTKTSFTMDTYAHILPSKKQTAVQRLDFLF
jgi:integrase